MKWKVDDEAWERMFAFFPLRVGNTQIWLEYFYRKWNKEKSSVDYAIYEYKSFDGEYLGEVEYFLSGD